MMILIDGQITKNFNIKEFACNDNGEILINKEVIAHTERLQAFRDWYLRPMNVSSGYRTVIYNQMVGGTVNSMHLYGLATDFLLPADEFANYDIDRKRLFYENVKNKWYEICAANGLGGGVGFYDTFIHLDSRTVKAFWDMRIENR
jgi:uncharacterized protein YcbK (DUF882 family)